MPFNVLYEYVLCILIVFARKGLFLQMLYMCICQIVICTNFIVCFFMHLFENLNDVYVSFLKEREMEDKV